MSGRFSRWGVFGAVLVTIALVTWTKAAEKPNAGETPADEPTAAVGGVGDAAPAAAEGAVAPAKPPTPILKPIAILGVGIVVVLGLIIGLKVNAFIALITAAMVVSLMADGPLAAKISRVAVAFGESAGGIGILIALAAIIGKCMLDSGAADRIVRGFLGLFGERHAPVALMGSGFVLAVPVFFDTVFYLLVPLARSLHRKTGVHFLKYVLAIGVGGAITHTLVPPTPGPAAMAENLGIDMGVMILVGLVVALPAAIVGLLFASLADRLMPVPMRSVSNEPDPEPLKDSQLPALWLSLTPVTLPVILISGNTIFARLAQTAGPDSWLKTAADISALVGDKNLALLISAAIAMATLVVQRGLTRVELARVVETALMSGGVIILITAAGGSFGAMLKTAQVGPAIESAFSSFGAGGLMILVLGFSVASLLKVAQGSSTVAMVTGSAMLADVVADGSLGCHTVYLATAIGAGSLAGSWMNDSGFWIFAKMSGLTEIEALKSWTVALLVLAFTGLTVTLLLANFMPYPPFTVAPQGITP